MMNLYKILTPKCVCIENDKCSACFNISLHFCFLFTSLPNLEKLIEGLKSPDTSLLLPDLLPMTDPFGSTSDAVIGKVIISVSSALHDLCVCFENDNYLVNRSLLNGPAGEWKCHKASFNLICYRPKWSVFPAFPGAPHCYFCFAW